MQEKRCHFIDALRGLALINMVAMHFFYDYYVVFGREPLWYRRPAVVVWQQYICWSFILIAGYAFLWGQKHNLRRGLLLNACGLVITAVTLLVTPEEAIRYGILTFMGCAVLITIPAEKLLRKLPPALGLILCAALFWFFRHVDAGLLPFGVRMPAALYRPGLAILGFPDAAFRSSDYFPLLPWLFLFWCGYYLRTLLEALPFWRRLSRVRVPLLSAVGRRTLWVYMLHQPVLMGICLLLEAFTR